MVCTANMARSPLFAALLQHHADQRLGTDVLKVGSAGTGARIGDLAAEGSQRLARRWRLSLHGHHSRPVVAVPLEATTLIIAMTRAHQRSLARTQPQLADRTFLLRELVEIVDRLGAPSPLIRSLPEPGDPHERLRAAVELAHDHRPRRLGRLMDVPDPLRGDPVVFEALAEEFSSTAQRLAAVFFGPAPV